jgi:hypothetical protein
MHAVYMFVDKSYIIVNMGVDYMLINTGDTGSHFKNSF